MGRPGNYQEKTFSNRYVQSCKQQSSRLSHQFFLKKATVVMCYKRVTVDFSSPNITPNLLKAAVFLLLEQRYGTPSHIILELLPLSAFKKQINNLAVI